MLKIPFLLSFLFLLSCSSKVTDISGLPNNEITIISDIPGNGIEIQNHYKVTVHYKGMLEDGKIFDSSYKRNLPFTFQYGLRQVIEGWEIGLINIKEGGKRTIKIPPNLAYGKNGVKNIIPPNSTLIFEINVLKIEPYNYRLISSDILLNFDKQNLFTDENEKLILIDIRDKENQLITGIIKNSFQITAFDKKGNLNSNFIKKYKSVSKKNDHVVLISEEGEISSILANGLVENLDMKNVYSLRGGIKEWIIQGYPIKK